MPARQPTPAGKQRVRTGCLTCRKRRRKCDEGKPRCENCEAKGLACRYGGNLTFVPSGSDSGTRTLDGAHGGNGSTYAAIQFVVDATVDDIQSDLQTPTPTVEPSQEFPPQQRPAQNTQDDNSTAPESGLVHDFASAVIVSEVRTPEEVSSTHFDVGISQLRQTSYQPEINVQTINDHAVLIRTTAATPISLARTCVESPPDHVSQNSYSGSQFSGTSISVGSHEETSLLCHFRYKLAIWIDIADPEASFGIRVMLAARDYKPLFTAIIALAACHRLLIVPQQRVDFEKSLRYRKAAEYSLQVATEPVRRVGNILLMLADFFSSSPHQWRLLIFQELGSSVRVSSFAPFEEDLNEPLFWLYFRIDLAAAIMSKQAPVMPYLTYLPDNGFPRSSFPSLSPGRSPKEVFQQSLFLLANCLSLVFGSYDTTVLRPENLDVETFPSMRTHSLLNRWMSLWNECQKWHSDRPVEVQEIFEVRGLDVDRVHGQSSSSFPILIYTTPLALVSNAIYHITSILLLTHKPRLLKAVPGPRCFSSHIWHAQSVAGIASSNDSLEQWDPVLVVGLLLVAREMTHESQQLVILERLENIIKTTGMKLGDEIKALKSSWQISSYDELQGF